MLEGCDEASFGFETPHELRTIRILGTNGFDGDLSADRGLVGLPHDSKRPLTEPRPQLEAAQALRLRLSRRGEQIVGLLEDSSFEFLKVGRRIDSQFVEELTL